MAPGIVRMRRNSPNRSGRAARAGGFPATAKFLLAQTQRSIESIAQELGYCSTFDFSAKEILENGRIVFPVGPKYLGCHVIVTRTNYLWFRPAPKDGQQVWEADDLPLPVHDWARMRTAWLAPGETLEFEAEIPEKKADFVENILHIEIFIVS